jgi:hypothetical protein
MYTLKQWRLGGGVWHPAQPIADLTAMFRGHGFTVYMR